MCVCVGGGLWSSPGAIHRANICLKQINYHRSSVDVGEGGQERPHSPVPGRVSVALVSADERR